VRVLFNGITTLKPKTGIAHAAANLHAALAAGFPADRFWLYPGARVAGAARRFFRPAGGAGPAARKPDGLKALARRAAGAAAKLGYAAHFALAARTGRFDLYHEPNFVPFRTGLPLVVTVFDLSVLLYPQWHPAERVKAHEAAFARGLPSPTTCSWAPRRCAPRHEAPGASGRPRHRDGVRGRPAVPPAAARGARTTAGEYGLPPRYTLYVGTIEPRKNVATLLRAFCALTPKAQAACPLVLAGGWGWKAEAERALFEPEAAPRGAIHLGYVPDDDLPALYAGAEALLYPSFYEGFGLPPVEAMACGTAAVTSTADAVREVVGTSALTLDPHNLDGWRDALARVAADREFLSYYRRRGLAHAAGFTWEACARVTHGVYRKVLGLPQPEAEVRAGGVKGRKALIHRLRR
jgi:alpha-1,3-rhamnosyl/mannosyltransferase